MIRAVRALRSVAIDVDNQVVHWPRRDVSQSNASIRQRTEASSLHMIQARQRPSSLVLEINFNDSMQVTV